MDVSILTATPIILGVLTCTEEAQAIERSTGDNNHGFDWGESSFFIGWRGCVNLIEEGKGQGRKNDMSLSTTVLVLLFRLWSFLL